MENNYEGDKVRKQISTLFELWAKMEPTLPKPPKYTVCACLIPFLPDDCSLALLPNLLALCLCKSTTLHFHTRAVFHVPVSEDICIMEQDQNSP